MSICKLNSFCRFGTIELINSITWLEPKSHCKEGEEISSIHSFLCTCCLFLSCPTLVEKAGCMMRPNNSCEGDFPTHYWWKLPVWYFCLLYVTAIILYSFIWKPKLVDNFKVSWSYLAPNVWNMWFTFKDDKFVNK